MSRGRKRFITSLALLGLSVFLCATPAAEAMPTVSSQAAAGRDDRAPGPVAEVHAELSLDGTNVTVSWTLSEDDFVRQAPVGGDFTSGGVFVNVNDVERYVIWRQTVGIGDPEWVGEAQSGEYSYIDNNVVMGATYVYFVAAYDRSDDEDGRGSAWVESEQVNLGPPPVSEVEVPEEAESAQYVSMTFEAELDLDDEEVVEEFAIDFVAQLALILGIDPSRITIVDIYEGSVVVEFTIDGDDAAEVQEELEELVNEDPEILADVAGTATEYGAISLVELDMGDVGIDESVTESFAYFNALQSEDAQDDEVLSLSERFDGNWYLEAQDGSEISDICVYEDGLEECSGGDQYDYFFEEDILTEFALVEGSDHEAVYMVELSDDNNSAILTIIEHPLFEEGTIVSGVRVDSEGNVVESVVEPVIESTLMVAAEIEGDGFSLGTESLILGEGEGGSIDVTFSAADVGSLSGVYEGVVTIETNDPAKLYTIVGLTATISEGLVVGDIVVSGAFNFASVAIGSSKELSLTLSNDGDLDLYGSIAFDGDPVFSAVGSDEDGNVVQITEVDFSLTGGEEIDIAVTFSPISAETYSGTIVITSDDEDEPEIAVDLSGAGFDAEEVQVLQDAEGNTILGDFDGNATVNFDDFFIFADNFGKDDFDEPTDLDGSGSVNFDDFFIFADNFGKSGTYVGVVVSAEVDDSDDA